MLKKNVTEYSHYFRKKQSQQRKQEKAMLNKRIATLEKKLACINLNLINICKLINKINEKLDK